MVAAAVKWTFSSITLPNPSSSGLTSFTQLLPHKSSFFFYGTQYHLRPRLKRPHMYYKRIYM
jgi:hypothetical protein